MDTYNRSYSIRDWAIRLVLILYDAFAVNASFFLALVVRFYINGKFSELGVPYISAFFSYAPYYTMCALIVFALFQMYNMIWRVAGVNDLKRIIFANLCTFVIQMAGSRIFVRRMPTTYYVIGAVIQFVLVCLIRFIPRILFYEGIQDKKKDAIPAMIIGTGENAMILQDRIRKDASSKERIVCLLDHTSDKGSRRLFNGLPMVYGIEHLSDAIARYKIGCVFIAERSIPDSLREEISKICSKAGVELRDFIIGTERIYGRITLYELMKTANGRVRVTDAGEEHLFETAEQAAMSSSGSAFVKSVEAKGDMLDITVAKTVPSDNSGDDEWKKKYKEENGEEVTFF
ncbi:MAG: hypothetical protein J6O70_04220 [Lachnospiraceae bacterium]|nr:hypothetical protein [Lachnospiraceae bacterium]